jgi:SRSO17 transposase
MIALDLMENVKRLKVPLKCIIADTDYGRVRKFREQLQKWEMPYIMSVRLDKLNVISEDTPIIRPEDVVKKRGRKRKKNYLPKGVKWVNPGKVAERTKDWTLIRWGEGAKGPLEAYFSRTRVRTVQWKYPSDEVGWLLLENGSEGVKAYMCWGLDNLTLKELVKLAHSRWAIEEYHKHIKNELGFDNFEGRKYRGWLHHSVLTQMAYAILQWMKWKHRGLNKDVSLPTLPEIRKILVSILVEKLQPDGGPNGLCRTCPIVMIIREAG